MLSRQQHSKSTNHYHFWNCNVLRSPAFHYQEGNILISDPRQVSSSHDSRPNVFLRQRANANKPKTSLRGSRVIKGKQNTIGQGTPEESRHILIINSQLEKTIAKPRQISTPFDQTINLDEKHRKASAFVKKFVPQIEKTVDFRRYVNEEQIYECSQTKRDMLLNQDAKLEPSIEIKCTNRSMEYSKDYKITEPFQRSCQKNIQQTNFPTERNISSSKITQYYSHQGLQAEKQGLMQYSQQASTRVSKKKNTRILHYIQRLPFKSAQSIDQTESAQVSEVISNVSSLSSTGNQSEQNAPKLKRLSQLLKPKYSRIALKAPVSPPQQL